MPHIAYIDKNFTKSTRAIIAEAGVIIADYQAQGYSLTLRQLYYQFVARDMLPNTQKSYSRLGSIINDARLAGEIDWDAIEDRTRNLARNPSWDSPADVINSAAVGYGIDKWAKQEYRVEVWVEKEALIGVFERVCRELDCPWFACRGYVSQSEMWRAAQRHKRWRGQQVIVLHFGDHDPSGIDMTRDIADRLALFRTDTSIVRVALNRDQIEKHDPPPNPAKVTDSRFDRYQAEHGDESWELDALEPSVLTGLVEQHVDNYRDLDLWEEACKREESERKELTVAASNWEAVTDFMTKNL